MSIRGQGSEEGAGDEEGPRSQADEEVAEAEDRRVIMQARARGDTGEGIDDDEESWSPDRPSRTSC